MAKDDNTRSAPFHVRTNGEGDGTFVSGHQTEDEAKAAAKRYNNEATAMGIKTRVHACDKP